MGDTSFTMALDISDTVYVNAARALVQRLEAHPMYDEIVQKTIDEIFEYSEDVHCSLSSLLQECDRKQCGTAEPEHASVGVEEGSY